MALDRFIYFTDLSMPSRGEIGRVLGNFFGDAAKGLEWEGHSFFVTLHGKPSFAFAGIEGAANRTYEDDERWIEVHFGDRNIDVITRMADAYTNTLAEGLAVEIARFWKGNRE